MVAGAQEPMVPVLNQLIPDTVLVSGLEERFVLSEHFDLEAVRDEAVRLTAGWTAIDGTEKTAEIDFLLFKDRTPITVTNFLGYVGRGDYTDMFVHRLVPGFVIQGGGFTVINDNSGSPAVGNVPTQPPIQNEFGVSNTLGTISMAKFGGDPDSATSQWFISTGANSDNLDFQNEGFTVFGRVSRASFPAALELDQLAEFSIFNLGGVFSSTPLVNGTTNPTFTAERFYRFQSVAEVPLPSGQAATNDTLTFDLEGDVNDEYLEVVVENGELVLNALLSDVGGKKEVVIKATDAVGNEVVDTFEVQVEVDYETWRNLFFPAGDAANDAISGPSADPDGDGVTNLTLFGQGLPAGETVTVKAPTIVSAGNNIILEIETPYREGLGLVLEVSDGLGSWSEVTSTRSTDLNARTKTESFRVSRSVANHPKSFFRIRYTLD